MVWKTFSLLPGTKNPAAGNSGSGIFFFQFYFKQVSSTPIMLINTVRMIMVVSAIAVR